MSFKDAILSIARTELKIKDTLGLKTTKQWFRTLLVHYTRIK